MNIITDSSPWSDPKGSADISAADLALSHTYIKGHTRQYSPLIEEKQQFAGDGDNSDNVDEMGDEAGDMFSTTFRRHPPVQTISPDNQPVNSFFPLPRTGDGGRQSTVTKTDDTTNSFSFQLDDR